MTICEIMSNNILLFKNFWSEDKKLAKKQCQEMPSGKTILLFSSFYHFLKWYIIFQLPDLGTSALASALLSDKVVTDSAVPGPSCEITIKTEPQTYHERSMSETIDVVGTTPGSTTVRSSKQIQSHT